MKLKKLWRRKSVDITEYDPTYKVIYLGNVLTGWAKGEGCVEKPLATLWRNYCQSSRPDISMKVTICGAGLRAVTREHGLTEYWAHRITHCSSHPAYPKVFCWVYRHEGRRLKQELRCHAVLCPKQGKAEKMSVELKDRLCVALHEFRREKAIRQNARLSVVNAALNEDAHGAHAAFPLRKFYLVTGAANYRPPLERSKSAPKLGAIDEETEDEDEGDGLARGEEEEGSLLRRQTEQEELVVSPLESLLSRFGETVEETSTEGGVAFVYQRVEEEEEGEDTGRASPALVTFSPPSLVVYCPPPTPPPPSTKRQEEEEEDHDLRLLEESFKAKLGTPPRGGGEESLTSDQPESLGSSSHTSSCSSSSCDGGGGGEGDGGLLEEEDEEEEGERVKVVVGKNKRNAKVLLEEGEEDNISEESGYSEDKDCITLKI